MEDGLSDNFVLSIAEDHKGFVWVGTEWGLNRFDGDSFQVFKSTDSLSTETISDNGINQLLVDSLANSLWIATQKRGLSRFDFATEQFYHYPTEGSSNQSTQSGGITDLCLSKDGNLWIATYNNGLKKLNKKDNFIRNIDLSSAPLPYDYRIKCINEDKNGNLYIGHWGNGLTILSANQSIKHFQYDSSQPKGIPGNEVMAIYIDSFDNVWIGTHYGLALYHPDTDEFTVFRNSAVNRRGLTDNDIHTIREINGSLWIGTWRGGINVLNLSTADFSKPEEVLFEGIDVNHMALGLSPFPIERLFEDSFGNVWVGTQGDGLNILKHITPFFSQISYSPLKEDNNSLSNKIIHTLVFDKENQLWVGSAQGVVDVFSKNENNDYTKTQSFHFEDEILSSLVDKSDNIWLGVNRKGLYRYDKKKKTVSNIKITDPTHLHSYLTCIYEDVKGNIWVGTHHGLFKYTPANDELKEYNTKSIQLENNLISDFIEDVCGNFWIASITDGVSVVTPELELINHYNESNGLLSNSVNQLCKDSKNRIRVATTKGISIYTPTDSKKYTAHHLNSSSGLPDVYIRSVAEGKPNEFWIATNAGVSHYLEDFDIIENYNQQDGIQWGTFNSRSVAQSADGVIFLGSQNGICFFDSKRKAKSLNLPPIQITRFVYHDSKADVIDNVVSMPVASSFDLQYNQSTFSIHFNVMDYALKDKVEYAFLLKGLSNDWHYLKNQNQAIFRNLSSGNYVFKVKGRVKNQEWSEEASINIKIHPPFWLSWWAKSFYLFCVLALVYGFFSFYKRRLLLENALYVEKENLFQEQKRNEEKLQFYTNIAHELRTPLTLIVGPLGDLQEDKKLDKKQQKKISLIHKSAMRLSNLINQILELKKSQSYSRTLKVVRGDIAETVYGIVLKFKELNRNEQVSVEFSKEPLPPIYYDVEVVTIILDNLLSNALKYTLQGIVSVSIRKKRVEEANYIEIEVRDTGCGIAGKDQEKVFNRYFQVNNKHQQEGVGIGLALVKNLVELHQGVILLESEESLGTSFYFRLPLENTYPQALHLETEPVEVDENEEVLPTLLVVEDNEDIREYIADSFEDAFVILKANDGKEGLELAVNHIPDLIISDIMMPIMDGNTLCKMIKENIHTSHIPVILLTAKDTERDKTEGYSVGADSYITKPFTTNLLKIRVKNLLEGRKRVAEYISTNYYKKNTLAKSISRLDDEFLGKVVSMIEDNMATAQISISFLSSQLGMSYSTFSRKMKAVTGLTANDFIRKTKMRYAEQLLLTGKYTISEVAYQLGYSSMSYFREAFKAEFGLLPSKYVSNLEED